MAELDDLEEPPAEVVDEYLGERLVAEARLAKWEARIERATRRVLAALLARVSADVRGLTAASWWDEPLVDPLLEQVLQAEIRPAATSVMDDVAAVLYELVPEELRTFPAIDFSRQVDRLTDRVRDMTLDVARQLGDSLREGTHAGESVDKLAKRVERTFTANSHRARTIARTEVVSSVNGAEYDQAAQLSAQGVALDKRWLAAHDARTRPSHAAADGQRVAFDQPFTVGGAELAYPGDPNGPAREVINCRCTTVWEPRP